MCLFRLSDHNIICFQQTQFLIFKQYIILKYLWLNKLDDWFIFENLGKYTSENLLNQDFLCQVSTERDFLWLSMNSWKTWFITEKLAKLPQYLLYRRHSNGLQIYEQAKNRS